MRIWIKASKLLKFFVFEILTPNAIFLSDDLMPALGLALVRVVNFSEVIAKERTFHQWHNNLVDSQ